MIAGIVTSPQLDFQTAEKANLHFSVTVVLHSLATTVGTLTLGLAKFFRSQFVVGVAERRGDLAAGRSNA